MFKIEATAICCSLFFIFIIIIPSPLAAEGGAVGISAPDELYLKYCSSCHHPERYGVSAPPLFKETIGNKGDKELKDTISKGLPATNMPAFENVLKPEEIDRIIPYIKLPIEKPRWGKEDILNSKIIPQSPQSQMAAPLTLTLSPSGRGEGEGLDHSNLFMVVEGGLGTVHFMDGNTFNLLDKVKVGAMHGGPKFDYNFNFSYILSRDGWLVKYDLKNFKETARIRVGINSRNLAVSDDGRYIAVANLLPQNMVFIDTERMMPLLIVDTEARVGAVYTLKKKGVFVAALREKPEVWLIDYKGNNPTAPPFIKGGTNGGFSDDNFKIKKLIIAQPFSDFFIEPSERYLVGAARSGEHLTVFDIEEGKNIKDIPISGMPHLASACVWKDGGRTFAAFPHIKSPILTIMDLSSWDIIKSVTLKGPGYFARTHESIPHIWVDTNTDTMQLVDKKDFKVLHELTPEKGKFTMHTEFTKDGSFALISVRENDGAVYIYDTKKLDILKKLPFNKPIGKYNATNKTH